MLYVSALNGMCLVTVVCVNSIYCAQLCKCWKKKYSYTSRLKMSHGAHGDKV